MSTWWLAQHVVTTGLLVLLVAVIGRGLRSRPALAHALWVVVLIKFVTPPLIFWPWQLEHWEFRGWRQENPSQSQPSSDPPRPSSATMEALVDLPMPHSNDELLPATEWQTLSSSVENTELAAALAELAEAPPVPPVVAEPFGWEWLPRLAIAVWLLGGLLVVVAHGYRIRRHWALLRGAAAAPPSLARDVGRVADLLHVRPLPTLVSRHIASPYVWCAGRLRLLWPERLADDGAVARCRGVIAHELAHVRRRDHWIAWLELAAGIVWWWNPLYWFVRRQLRETAEIACDALALSVLPDSRLAYAEVFLELSTGVHATAPAPALGALAGAGQSFERRFAMILSEQVPARMSRTGLLAACLLALVALPGWSLAQVASSADEPAAPPKPAAVPLPEVYAPAVPQPPLPTASTEEPKSVEARLQKIEATLDLILKRLEGAEKAGRSPSDPLLPKTYLQNPLNDAAPGKPLANLIIGRRRYLLHQESGQPSLTAVDSESGKLLWRSDLSEALKRTGDSKQPLQWHLMESLDDHLLAIAARRDLMVHVTLDAQTGQIAQVSITGPTGTRTTAPASRTVAPRAPPALPAPVTLPVPHLPKVPQKPSVPAVAPAAAQSAPDPSAPTLIRNTPAALPAFAEPATTSAGAATASGMTQLDLVNLATTYIDTLGKLKVARSRYARLKAAGTDAVPSSELDVAAIELETAQQKANLLTTVAKTAYEAAEAEFAHVERLRHQNLSTQGAVAAARARVKLLEAILQERPAPATSTTTDPAPRTP